MLERLSIEDAIEALKAGELIVFPTEATYVLGGRALSEDVGDRVLAAKRRPAGKPLPILLPHRGIVEESESPLLLLADTFWPGPLTLIVPAFPGLPAVVTAGTNMVGVRMSAHPVAQALVRGVDEPLISTSANRSGNSAAMSLEECDEALLAGVAGVVDGGTLTGGRTTVVGLVDADLCLHSEGAISEEALRAVWAPARRR